MTRKRSRVVREGVERKGPKGTSLAAYFMVWLESRYSSRGSHAPPRRVGNSHTGRRTTGDHTRKEGLTWMCQEIFLKSGAEKAQISGER